MSTLWVTESDESWGLPDSDPDHGKSVHPVAFFLKDIFALSEFTSHDRVFTLVTVQRGPARQQFAVRTPLAEVVDKLEALLGAS